MQTLNTTPNMDIVDEILRDTFNDDYFLAMDVKEQVKRAEQYGGLTKVAVCKITQKRANLVEKRVELTATEAVIADDRRGKNTYECCIDASSVAEAMHICDMIVTQYTYIAIDRRSGAIIAYWRD